MLTVIIGLSVTSLLLLYVAAPLLVRFLNKQPADPRIERIGPDRVRPELAGFSRQVAAGLASQGFAPAAYLWCPNPAAGLDTQLLVLTNPSSKESAAVIDMCVAKAGAAHLRQTYVEFCTEFVNGEEICTHNSGTAAVTKADPLKRVFHFPAVKSPLLLYGAHRRLVDRHAPPAERFIPTPGTEHLHLAHSLNKAHDRQVEFGYMYLDEASGDYRPTLKGAFLMAWKLAWPVKQVREAMAKREAAATLRSLGA
jgi:hypothetical protein